MTALATVLQFTRWEQNADAVDPEADIEFFSMSPASAEQVTIQIHTLLDRAWEYIALAYKGRAHVALGYSSWDDYVDARFSDLQLAVPREHRTQVVTTLAGASMSVRAIAKLLGVGIATVHREMVRGGVPDQTPGGSDDPPKVLGRDGKSYPRERRHAARSPCTMCGDVHDEDPTECPWDLYAQGLGPHPRRRGDLEREEQPDPRPYDTANPVVPRRRRYSSPATPGGAYAETATEAPVDGGGADVSPMTSASDLLASAELVCDQISAFAESPTSLLSGAPLEREIFAGRAENIAARFQHVANTLRVVDQSLHAVTADGG